MAVYSRIQFCMPQGVSPAFELRQHSGLPDVLMLTFSHENGEVVFDGTAETMRGLLMSLLGHPLLAGPATTPDSDSSFYAEAP